MIVEILPSSIEYLLGDRDCNGNHRPSMIVDGCYATFMSEYAKAKKYSHPYLTFCLRDPKPLRELGGQQFLDDIIRDFKMHVLPGFDNDQVQCLAIMHDNSKHDFELNLLMLQQVNNRKVGLYYDRIARPYFKTFGEFIHRKYPQLTSPNQRDLIRDLADPNKFWDTKQQELYDVICAYANPCKLNNRKEFVELLRNHLQLNVNDRDSNSLIVSDGHTAIKLRGNLCQSDFSRCEREGSVSKTDEQIYGEYIKYARQYHNKLLSKYKFLIDIINNESYLKQDARATDKQHVANNTQTHDYRVEQSEFRIDQIDINRDERSIAINRPERNRIRAGGNSKRSDLCNQVVDCTKHAIRRVAERSKRYDKVVQELLVTIGKQGEPDLRTDLTNEEGTRNVKGRNSPESSSTESSITSVLDNIAKALDQIIRPQRKSIIAEIIELLHELLTQPPDTDKAKPILAPKKQEKQADTQAQTSQTVQPKTTEFQTQVNTFVKVLCRQFKDEIKRSEMGDNLTLLALNAVKHNIPLTDIQGCKTIDDVESMIDNAMNKPPQSTEMWR